MDALDLAFLLLGGALLAALLGVAWLARRLALREPPVSSSTPSDTDSSLQLQTTTLAEKLERLLELLSGNPAAQGRLGEERLELIMASLPRRYWQRQPTLASGHRPDYLLTLGPGLSVPVDAKLLGATGLLAGEGPPADLDRRVRAAAQEVARRYLGPTATAPLALLVLPPGVHIGLEAATLQRCHSLGVTPTPAEGVAALALLLSHLAPWLRSSATQEPAQGLAATRRALAAALELLERAGRQGRNSRENLDRARQVLEGARLRLEGAENRRPAGGYTPPLEEAWAGLDRGSGPTKAKG